MVAATAATVAGAAPAAGDGRACETDPCRADVGIAGHSEPQPIHRGEVTRLKVTAKNNGYDGALGIDLQVTVPWQLRILRVRRYGGNRCRWKQGFVRCDFGDFKREQEAVAVIYVRARRLGTFIAHGRVYSSGVVDPNGGNNQVGITVPVLRRPRT